MWMVSNKSISSFKDFHPKKGGDRVRQIEPPPSNCLNMVGFFDGASYDISNRCGARTYIRVINSNIWLILSFSRSWNIKDLEIFGDSKIIVDWRP